MLAFRPFEQGGIDPEGMREVVLLWRKFTILRTALDNAMSVDQILRGPDPTYSRLATFLALRLFPDRGSVDLVEDLIWRLDRRGQLELAQVLFPNLFLGVRPGDSADYGDRL